MEDYQVEVTALLMYIVELLQLVIMIKTSRTENDEYKLVDVKDYQD